MKTKNVPRPLPTLLSFFKKYLPPSLVVHGHTEGYCRQYYIEQVGTGISFPWCSRNKVARINSGSLEIELFDETWHMDVTDVIIKYESITQKEITLVRQVGPTYD